MKHTDWLLFRVDGEPRGKQRPRFTKQGRTYTPKETRQYEQEIREAALNRAVASGYLKPEGAVRVSITAWFSPPASWSKKKRAAAMAGHIYPAVKPDADNLGKAFLDALNEIAYRDDKQVVECTIKKRYTFSEDDTPHVTVHVERMPTPVEMKEAA
jgi:endodeoxyribonuclease rusA